MKKYLYRDPKTYMTIKVSEVQGLSHPEGLIWVEDKNGKKTAVQKWNLQEIIERTDLEMLEHLISTHDLTYAYFDDHHIYQNGRNNLVKIESLAKLYPVEATEMWKKMVDGYLLDPEVRKQFYKTFTR